MKAKRLSDLKNIGKQSEGWLNQVGIYTPEDLSQMGAVEVWKLVKEIEPNASLIGVYALQGALMDINWRDLPDDIKADLRRKWEGRS